MLLVLWQHGVAGPQWAIKMVYTGIFLEYEEFRFEDFGSFDALRLEKDPDLPNVRFMMQETIPDTTPGMRTQRIRTGTIGKLGTLALAACLGQGCNTSSQPKEEECWIESFGGRISCEAWEEYQNINRPKSDSVIRKELASGAAITYDTAVGVKDGYGQGLSLYGQRFIRYSSKVLSFGGSQYDNGSYTSWDGICLFPDATCKEEYQSSFPYLTEFNLVQRGDSLFAFGGAQRINSFSGAETLNSNPFIYASPDGTKWDTLPVRVENYDRMDADVFSLAGSWYSLGGTAIRGGAVRVDGTESAWRSSDLVHWERFGTEPPIQDFRAFTDGKAAWAYNRGACYRSADFNAWEKVNLASKADTIGDISYMFPYHSEYVMVSLGRNAVYWTEDFRTFHRKFLYDKPGRIPSKAGDNFIVVDDYVYVFSGFKDRYAKGDLFRRLDLRLLAD